MGPALMDALVTTFIAAILAEVGDKTQLLVLALAIRFRRPLPVLLGVAVAAFANNLLAAFGGVLVSGLITIRAISLLVAIALIFAGVAGFLRQKDEGDMGSTWKTGPFITTAACFFLLEFGDKTQFLTAALAAQYNAVAFAAAGATAGVIVANIPVALLGDRTQAAMPLKPIRYFIAAVFLLAGFLVAVNALRLT
jgi:putative Ca2+/H+ antiporter (TMEM165/GDT1 family)